MIQTRNALRIICLNIFLLPTIIRFNYFLINVDDAEKKNLMDTFLQNISKNELANVLKHMVVGDLESINTSYPTHILKLLQNATDNAKSSSEHKSLLANLKSEILKFKKQQGDHLNKTEIDNFRDILNQYEKGGGSKDDLFKKIAHLLSNHQSVNESNVKLNSTIDKLVFNGTGTKDAIFGQKNKETVSGKKVIVESIDNTKDILKQGKRKMMRANIVLPDATNVNTHIADVVQNPGKITKAIVRTLIIINQSLSLLRSKIYLLTLFPKAKRNI